MRNQFKSVLLKILETCAESTAKHMNIGIGKEIYIAKLANTIKETNGFKGDLVFNTSKPDATKFKL